MNSWYPHPKYAFIPEMLQVFVKSNRGRVAIQESMREMEAVNLVSLKTPFTKKKRLKTMVDKIVYAATRREWHFRRPGGQGDENVKYNKKHFPPSRCSFIEDISHGGHTIRSTSESRRWLVVESRTRKESPQRKSS